MRAQYEHSHRPTLDCGASLRPSALMRPQESEEAQNLWQALFTFAPILWSVLTAVGAELVEAGLLQCVASAPHFVLAQRPTFTVKLPTRPAHIHSSAVRHVRTRRVPSPHARPQVCFKCIAST